MFFSSTRLSSLWGRLHTSFWFLPAAMSGVAVALSIVLVQFDVWLGVGVVPKFNLLYTFGPEGARAILSVIASSMITVASLIFSITMLTLQLVSSQFGPRVLRNFRYLPLLSARAAHGSGHGEFQLRAAFIRCIWCASCNRERRGSDLFHPSYRHFNSNRDAAGPSRR
jgi:hypothetical protein